MSQEPISRVEALKDLTGHRVPVEVASAALSAFAWDEEELIDLTAEDLVRLLAEFESGSVTATELTQWADAVESRDDLGRESGREQQLNDALFALSSPELLEEDFASTVRRLHAELSGQRP